jgi:hypothetical protein
MRRFRSSARQAENGFVATQIVSSEAAGRNNQDKPSSAQPPSNLSLPGSPNLIPQHEDADMIRTSDSKEHCQIHDLSAVLNVEV